MKKNWLLTLAALFVMGVCTFILTSCGSDDDEIEIETPQFDVYGSVVINGTKYNQYTRSTYSRDDSYWSHWTEVSVSEEYTMPNYTIHLQISKCKQGQEVELWNAKIEKGVVAGFVPTAKLVSGRLVCSKCTEKEFVIKFENAKFVNERDEKYTIDGQLSYLWAD